MCIGCVPGPMVLAQAFSRTMDADCPSINLMAAPASNHKGIPQAIFYGGSIITMAGGFFCPVEALVTGGPSGQILYAGTLEGAKKMAGANTDMIDLGTRCLLPGFVEPHVHLLLTALMQKFFVNVTPLKAPTLNEALTRLKERVRGADDNQWLAGYGYDPARVEGHLELSAKLLDEVSLTVPIVVLNDSGHIAYVNHKAFAVAGIDNSTANPAGGEFQRDRDGRLTGVIVEQSAIAVFTKRLTPPPVPEFVESGRETLRTWASKGCTTIFDAGVGLVRPGTDMDVRLMSAVAAPPDCPIRLVGAMTSELATFVKAAKPPYIAGNVEYRSIKFWADGSTQGFTGAVREPYLDDKGWGILTMSDTELRQGMATWQKLGWQLLVHANADRAIDQTLGAYDAILDHKPDPNIAHRIEHFTVTKPEQLVHAKRLGLGVSHTIGHVYYWGNVFRTWVLGPERAERLDPVAEDAANGLVFSFHSDSPVTDVDPLLYVRTAVMRQMYGRDPRDVLGREQRVDLETALRGVTINAARHVMLGEQIGSLEVGKSADLVVLDRDPREVSPSDLDKVRVEQTWLRGRLVWSSAAR
ncbi:hypothetical protein D9615_010158 [Tricholomella constricta]|uniref:Amidohydrolase 3 domain-containing protein n=1 Tax=Tricholomella constricta TaxID=117010 RepID=A0A8H5LU85_9AGAR|nr:hypothetical protein D9615_010158 [Tricholomella constricta]